MNGTRTMVSERAIAQLNIEHFQRLIATELDETTRQTVEKLLAETRIELRTADSGS